MVFNIDKVSQKHKWPCSSIEFCEDFFNSEKPKYILGRNIYAENVAKYVDIDGFIDDFSNEKFFLKKPIVKSAAVPKNALVLNAAGGKPLTAREKLNQLRLKNLDYFAFSKISEYPSLPLRFNEGFEDEFLLNQQKYNWIYQLLKDEESRLIFEKLIKFRYSHDISLLEGFTQRENVQYFEKFLMLDKSNEVFVDVGGFNGFTTLEFIKLCPQYSSVHIFEPDKDNYELCVAATLKLRDIYCYPLGLGSKKDISYFRMSDSSSSITEDGDVLINVDRLDNLSHIAPSFIKIDIEGSEFSAIQGAKKVILGNHPRLAISVYHKPGDFWRIPELILGIRDDYDILIRHYTESIYETVMFFLPRK